MKVQGVQRVNNTQRKYLGPQEATMTSQVAEVTLPNQQVSEITPPNQQVSDTTGSTDSSGRAQSERCLMPPYNAPFSSYTRAQLSHTSNGRDHLSLQSDLRRQNQTILTEMGSHYPGHMGNSDCDRGLSHSPHVGPQPKLPSSYSPPLLRGLGSIGGGDTVSPAETGSLPNTTSCEGILFKHVYSPQEGRWSETSHQFEVPHQTCEIRAFQDGGPPHSQSSPKERRLYGKGGPEGRFLHGSL